MFIRYYGNILWYILNSIEPFSGSLFGPINTFTRKENLKNHAVKEIEYCIHSLVYDLQHIFLL